MRLRDYFDPRTPAGSIGWAIAVAYLLFVGLPIVVVCGLGMCAP